MYALSAWGGYISIDNVGRLNKILRKAKRYGYTDSLLTFSELLEQSDEQLFSRDLEDILFIYPDISITLPENLLFSEIYTYVSNKLTYYP